MSGYPETPTRFVHTVGWWSNTVVWFGEKGSCGENSSHVLRQEIQRGEGEYTNPQECWGDYHSIVIAEGTPCEKCGAPYAAELEESRSAGAHPLYDTESGMAESGCMYWRTTQLHEDGVCVFNRWTNCDGRHLMVVLPNGHHWDVDSRANNCDKQEDTTHRCWVRSGNPETEPVTAGKDGPTCTAGAGSIQSGDYHGFLVNGVLSAG